MSTGVIMDNIDRKIVSLLCRNARISNQNIARQVNLAPSAVLKRMHRLENAGILKNYTARIDHRALGLDMNVLIQVVTNESVGAVNIGKQLSALPDICDVFDVAGNISYIVRAVVKNTEALNSLIIRMGQIPGVMRTQTTLIMNIFKNELSVSLDELPDSQLTDR